MKTLRRKLCVALGGPVALCLLLSSARAGTNDLFSADAIFRCSGTKTRMKWAKAELMNLALGRTLDADSSANLNLGLQCDCSTRQVRLVIYDTASLDTVATIADIATVSYRSNGKTAVVVGTGNIRNNGFLLGGEFSARMVVRLDADACITRATVSATGTLQLETTEGGVTMNLRRAKLRTFGLQLRPVASTGSGDYGLQEELHSAPGGPATLNPNLPDEIRNLPPPRDQPVVTLRYLLGGLNVGSNAVVDVQSLEWGTDTPWGGTLIIPDGCGMPVPIAVLYPDAQINLGNGSQLNVCTNGVPAPLLEYFRGRVFGEGTVNLIDCAPPIAP